MKELERLKELEEYYRILEIDENVTEFELKKAYRLASKKYHPDTPLTGNKEIFQKISEAYEELNSLVVQKEYKALKEKYTTKPSSSPYLFNRRDGSKIEIQPIEKLVINFEPFYHYKIFQYYDEATFINDVYGRINLDALLNSKNYCDFCVNQFLSKSYINHSCLHYNGYIGYIEAAIRNGITLYRKHDTSEEDAIYSDSELLRKSPYCILEDDDTCIDFRKIGTVLTKGKTINHYSVWVDDFHHSIYSDDIDFSKVKRDLKYQNAAKKLVDTNEPYSNLYVSKILYNPKTDDYDIVTDNELETFFKEENFSRQNDR